LAAAGLVLVPVGVVLLAAGVTVAGTVCLAAGWLLVVAAVAHALRNPGTGGPAWRGTLPTFIVATAGAAVAVGAEEPLAGALVSYLAVLWLCVRFWHQIDR
jgi:hypothetical protein